MTKFPVMGTLEQIDGFLNMEANAKSFYRSKYYCITKDAKMKLLVANRTMYMVFADRIYSDPISQSKNEIDSYFDWDLQNPSIKTIEQLYLNWPDFRTINGLKFVKV